jgi:hypothetical protein
LKFSKFHNFYTLALLLWSGAFGFGQQNLILNPSAEQGTVLQNQPWFDNVDYWWQLGSCDAYSLNYNLDNTEYRYCNLCIPLNNLGYQQPHHGANYLGFGSAVVIWRPLTVNTGSEIMGGHFSAPLTQNKKYLFSFYGSVADTIPHIFSKSLSVKLLQDTAGVNYANYMSVGNIVWNIDTMITNTTDWVKFEFSFTATGGEKVFMLGNFTLGEPLAWILAPNTDTAFLTGYPSGTTYWYVDDFSLTEILEPQPPTPQIPFTDNITISNNPGNAQNPTLFKVNLNKEAEAKLTIYDEAARIIITHTFTADQEQYKLENLAGAVYFYTFESSNAVYLSGKVIQF